MDADHGSEVPMQEMLRLAVLEIWRAYDLKLEPCSSRARIRCSKAVKDAVRMIILQRQAAVN
jgi:hypothetical protein